MITGNRKDYPKSIAEWFVDSRLPVEVVSEFHSGFEKIYKPQNEQILVTTDL